MKPSPRSDRSVVQQPEVPHAAPLFAFRLFVGGFAPGSLRAVAALSRICHRLPPDRYELEVIDVCQQPALARSDQIVAVPTLIKRSPSPVRRLVGDLSDCERVLRVLDLAERD